MYLFARLGLYFCSQRPHTCGVYDESIEKMNMEQTKQIQEDTDTETEMSDDEENDDEDEDEDKVMKETKPNQPCMKENERKQIAKESETTKISEGSTQLSSVTAQGAFESKSDPKKKKQQQQQQQRKKPLRYEGRECCLQSGASFVRYMQRTSGATEPVIPLVCLFPCL